MRFFPSLTEEFTSPLPPAELLRRVAAACPPPPPATGWRALLARAPGPFEGTVAGDGFQMQRVIDYRNSLLPRITGRVAPALTGPGSRLRLRHALHPFVLAFAGLWLGLVSLTTLSLGAAWLQAPTRFDPVALVPVGMLVFGALFFTVPFWLEVRQSRPRLIELLTLTPAPTA